MSDTSAMGPVDSAAKAGSWFSAGKAIVGVLIILLIVVGVGAYIMYSNEEQAIADARQQAATLSGQLTKSQQETKDRQAELDTTKGQLASAQADLATSQSNGKSLSDQLAKSQQDTQTAQASAKDLEGKNASLTTSLNQAQKTAQDNQTAAKALAQGIVQALPKAQLLAEFNAAELEWRQTGDDTKWRANISTWLRHVDALGDPTIEKYLADYDAAIAKKDKNGWVTFLDKTLAYLSNGVVDSLSIQ